MSCFWPKYIMFELKRVQRSHIWLHWRLMQNLKEKWLVLYKMTSKYHIILTELWIFFLSWVKFFVKKVSFLAKTAVSTLYFLALHSQPCPTLPCCIILTLLLVLTWSINSWNIQQKCGHFRNFIVIFLIFW